MKDSRTLLLIDGKPAVIGQMVTLSNEQVKLDGWRPPHKPASSGFVYVDGREYYAHVVNGKFVEPEKATNP